MTDRMKELGFTEVSPEQLDKNVFTAIGKQWMLITAGDESGSNTMTASWGGMGVIWNKNVVTALIRHSRHTKGFVDSADLFTLSFYPEEQRKVLGFCGSKSGRDFEPDGKAKAAGLTALYLDGTTAYEEAELVLVCKKLFASDLAPEGFLDKSLLDAFYADKDWHTAYIAEITAAYVKK